jgi:hypothetical protein
MGVILKGEEKVTEENEVQKLRYQGVRWVIHVAVKRQPEKWQGFVYRKIM